MTEMTLEHIPFTDDDGVRYCACGCGEPLKVDAKRSYIHGHKLRMMEGEVPDDPEPSDEAKVRATVRVTVRVKKEMQDSIEAYLALGAGMWAMSDPLCGGILVEQSTAIAEKLVPILARNQTMVRYFRSTSTFKETMDLLLVLWPVAQMVGRHHLFHTVAVAGSDTPPVDYNAFVA